MWRRWSLSLIVLIERYEDEHVPEITEV